MTFLQEIRHSVVWRENQTFSFFCWSESICKQIKSIQIMNRMALLRTASITTAA